MIQKGDAPINSLKSDILYVGGSGHGNYSSIQEAIDNATDGDTVFVYDDSSPYYENIIMYKSIILIGEHKNSTIVEDGGSGIVIHIIADKVTVTGFTIQSRAIQPGDAVGIEVTSNHTIIIGNILKDGLEQGNNYGIRLQSSSNISIIDNTFVSEGIWIHGNLSVWTTHTICNNTVNNRPLYYFKNNESGGEIPLDAGQVILANCTNFTIQHLEISDVENCIQLGYSCYNTIKHNKISNTGFIGIRLFHSSNNSIINNTLSKAVVMGIALHKSNYNIIINNTITDTASWLFDNFAIALDRSFGNSIAYNTVSYTQGYGISLYKSSNNQIYRNYLTSNWQGILLFLYNYNNTIYENNITKQSFNGIQITSSAKYNTVINNTFIRNYCGIILAFSVKYNNISHNIFKGNLNGGICLYFEANNNIIFKNSFINEKKWGVITGGAEGQFIAKNIFINAAKAIYIGEGSNTKIVKNSFIENKIGIELYESHSNTIYHNNFINNTQQALANESHMNTWDNGHPSGGNYWSDFDEPSEGAWDNDSDGIVDSSYNISGDSNQDHYPLIKPWNETEPIPICGDVNADRVIDAVDVMYLINYLFNGGDEPVPMICVGDCNHNGIVNVGDVVYLINCGDPPAGCCE